MVKKIEEKLTKGEQTKKKILVEALQLYSEKGVQNTPFQEIADKVGITQAALYKYFANRDELLKDAVWLAGVMGREYFQIDPKIEAKMTEKEKFFHYIKVNIDWAQNSKPYNVGLLSLHYFATQIPAIGEVHKEVMNLRMNKIKTLISNWVKEEDKKIENINPVIISVHNMLLGEMLEAYNLSGNETIKKRADRVFMNIQKMLDL